MVASFVIPAHLAVPSPVSADPGIMKWDTVSTPGSWNDKNDILSNPNFATWGDNPTGSEVFYLAAGNDGRTLLASVLVDSNTFVAPTPAAPAGFGRGVLYVSFDGGISWSISNYHFFNFCTSSFWSNFSSICFMDFWFR